MVSGLKTCFTKAANSDGINGWMYSEDIKVLASIISSSSAVAEQTVYTWVGVSDLEVKNLISECCNLSIDLISISVSSKD